MERPTWSPRQRHAAPDRSTVLDDESTDTDTTTSSENAEATPKKAPRKRATRAAAAPTFTDVVTAEPPGTPEAAATEDAGAAPAKKAAKKAPAKKAAPRKRTPKADTAAADAAETAAEAAEAPEAPETAEDPETAPRRRTRAPAVVVTFQAPETTDAPARPRRRAGTTGAVSPSELLAETGSEETDEDTELEVEEGVAGAAARKRRRGRRGRGGARPQGTDGTEDESEDTEDEGEGDESEDGTEGVAGTTRRRRRRRSSGAGGQGSGDDSEDGVPTVVHVREPRQRPRRDGGGEADEDGVRGISGSTRMAAKRVRRQEGRDSGRKRAPVLTEAEFLARREAVDRQMVVRQKGDRTQIVVLEDGILVEHYVTRATATNYAGNVYLGKVQNVLPSMEAAFVDVGKGRNAVLYAGEVNWEGVANGQRKIEQVLKSGQEVLVQVTKDPIGHKGARLTSQISLPGRYLVYVPEGSMTGISRKLPENERTRLKNILKNVVPEGAGVIIRTAAEGASEEEIAKDVKRLQAQWGVIKEKSEKGGAPKLLHAEPDLVIKVIRDVFNEDFNGLVVQGDSEWDTIREYVEFVAPDLAPRMKRFAGQGDVFAEHRIDEQLLKALDRKVYLPSGGSLVIDRTEAMVVIDVNTGKYVGKGGNLEETVTRNNLEAAEEIARQLRLRDLGGIIVVDFIDMVLESNRDLVVRRLVECLGRDRTKHQVAEVTSLGLVQMTRKRVGQGLLESFSEPCEHCNGRGVKIHLDPVDPKPERDRDRTPKVGAKAPLPAGSTPADAPSEGGGGSRSRRRRGGRGQGSGSADGGELVTDSEVVTSDADGSRREDDVPAQEGAVEAPFDLAEQPSTEAENQPVVPLTPVHPVPESEDELRVADAEEEGWPTPEAQLHGVPPRSVPQEDPQVSDAEEEGLPPVPEVAKEPGPKRRRAAGRPAGAPTV
jgi:ribonuclease E